MMRHWGVEFRVSGSIRDLAAVKQSRKVGLLNKTNDSSISPDENLGTPSRGLQIVASKVGQLETLGPKRQNRRP